LLKENAGPIQADRAAPIAAAEVWPSPNAMALAQPGRRDASEAKAQPAVLAVPFCPKPSRTTATAAGWSGCRSRRCLEQAMRHDALSLLAQAANLRGQGTRQ